MPSAASLRHRFFSAQRSSGFKILRGVFVLDLHIPETVLNRTMLELVHRRFLLYVLLLIHYVPVSGFDDLQFPVSLGGDDNDKEPYLRFPVLSENNTGFMFAQEAPCGRRVWCHRLFVRSADSTDRRQAGDKAKHG